MSSRPDGGRLVFHVGYPKTGTTTLQRHVFPHLEKVDYLGKFIPGYGFSDPALYSAIDELLGAMIGNWGPERMKALYPAPAAGRTTLLSSEAFIHPVAADPLIVAERLHAAWPDARILITVRSQQELLASFYRNHGAFASFLYLAKKEGAPLGLPLGYSEWLDYNFLAPSKNLLGLLDFDHVIACYEQVFEPARVDVLLFEDMASQPEVFAEGLGRCINAPGPEIALLLNGRHENMGLGAAAFERLGRLAAGTALGALEDSYAAATPGDPPVPVASSEADKARVHARFAASNTRLAARRGLDFARHDYPMEVHPWV